MIEHKIENIDDIAYELYKISFHAIYMYTFYEIDYFIKNKKYFKKYYDKANQILRKKKLEKIINHVQ